MRAAAGRLFPSVWFCAVAACLLLGGCGSGGTGSKASSRSVVLARTGSTGAESLAGDAAKSPSTPGLRGDEDDDDERTSERTEHDPVDYDFDNDSREVVAKSFFDADDAAIRSYGKEASGSQRVEIASVAKRYVAAVVAADGARACALMYSTLAEAIPEDYGRGAGPSYARGSTCPVVMSKIFRHDRAKLAGGAVIVAVRVQANQARVLVGSKTAPASYLSLRRERKRMWKIETLMALQLQ